MIPTLHITLYGAKLPSKKNSKVIAFNRKTNRPFIISSSDYSKWHQNASKELLQWKIKRKADGITFPIQRCRLNVCFFFPDNRHKDLDNKLASILDLLVDNRIILSDRWQVVRPIEVDAGISKTTPRVEIYLSHADDTVRSR